MQFQRTFDEKEMRSPLSYRRACPPGVRSSFPTPGMPLCEAWGAIEWLASKVASLAEEARQDRSNWLGVRTRFEILGGLATGREPATHHPNTELVDSVGDFQGQRDGTEHAGLD